MSEQYRHLPANALPDRYVADLESELRDLREQLVTVRLKHNQVAASLKHTEAERDAANERVRELEQELEAYVRHHEESAHAAIADQDERVRELEATLTRYGSHRMDCALKNGRDHCTCGYARIVTDVRQVREQRRANQEVELARRGLPTPDSFWQDARRMES